MGAVTIRRANNDDSSRIGELRSMLHASMKSFRGGELLWNEKHQSPDMHRTTVYVAEIDDYVIGYMVLAIRVDQMEIFEVFVDSDMRSIGAGDALVHAAIEAATAESVTALVADALPGDRDGKNLFERAGLISQRLIMRRET